MSWPSLSQLKAEIALKRMASPTHVSPQVLDGGAWKAEGELLQFPEGDLAVRIVPENTSDFSFWRSWDTLVSTRLCRVRRLAKQWPHMSCYLRQLTNSCV
jgi:hypothetical protein